ncbi:hypothetical protein LGT39_04220 [Demequina sp. TTPB684]|uniref:hypothetical protein n=1 Tax=unclassified Demequina TaxID=2620311 RepID=UPI001CF56F55|nr:MULTISPECIES: hypothetical protein [unclassified Demequina]MCB2412053.1 hypothetical protein [Demequina sp. TTPB684]UPU88022.1 hypothetical protein LGT36_012340 [Demequina sp. TMPB413]
MSHELRAPGDDDPVVMTAEERSVWVYLVVVTITSVTYFAIVIPRAITQPIEDVSWITPMLWTLGFSIVGTIVGSIVGAIGGAVGLAARGINPEGQLEGDLRDKDIKRLGDRRAAATSGAAMFGVLVLAMIGADLFWIGNLVFLAGTVGAYVETLTKIAAYRRGF